jgi:hypothetical protein
MKECFAYNANRFKHTGRSDFETWGSLFNAINYNISFIDRSHVIKMPIRTAVPPHLEIPTYDPNFSMNYEDCCQNRVLDIIKKQEELDVPIRLLYSGGIDSSMILVSFIKQLGMNEAEKRIHITMSMDGIEENPWMWDKFLRRSQFKILTSEKHGGDWGKDRILVGGEFNDQIMGSDVYREMVRLKGDSILEKPWSTDLIMEFFVDKGLSMRDALVWSKIITDLLNRAPCPIDTVADWWWWINFSCKWLSVYFRILMYARNDGIIDHDYLQTYYHQFFGDENFQKWSMARKEPKHEGSWLAYKPIPKKLVSDFMQAPEYMQKVKRGSLWSILAYKKSVEVIDDTYGYHWDVNPLDWYNEDNSFRYQR